MFRKKYPFRVIIFLGNQETAGNPVSQNETIISCQLWHEMKTQKQNCGFERFCRTSMTYKSQHKTWIVTARHHIRQLAWEKLLSLPHLAVSVHSLLSVFCWPGRSCWAFHGRSGAQLSTRIWEEENEHAFKLQLPSQLQCVFVATVRSSPHRRSIRRCHHHLGLVVQRRPGQRSTETPKVHWCCRRG